jgi:caffeoyl-CoA O-methyltransferase
MIYSQELTDYIENKSTSEDPVLYNLNRETHLKILNPNMLSGQVQGKFLEFISRMIRPGFVLEIGTYTGYSAICLARGLAPGGKVITIEINDELKPMVLKYIQESGMESEIELLTGNALEIIPNLTHSFDLAYIDGEKKEYLSYYELALEKLKPGGFMLIDNVLWGGKVLDTKSSAEADTEAIISLNHQIFEDKRVENVILPLRDGINVVRKIR